MPLRPLTKTNVYSTQEAEEGDDMHLWRSGVLTFAAAALIGSALVGSALAQSTTPNPASNSGNARWVTLSSGLSCSQMKQRVDAILSSNTTYKDPMTGGGANPNNSGITAR